MDLSKYVTVKVLSRPCSVGPFPARNAARPTGVPRPRFRYRSTENFVFVSPRPRLFPGPILVAPSYSSPGTKHPLPWRGKNPPEWHRLRRRRRSRRRRKVVCDCYHVRGWRPAAAASNTARKTNPGGDTSDGDPSQWQPWIPARSSIGRPPGRDAGEVFSPQQRSPLVHVFSQVSHPYSRFSSSLPCVLGFCFICLNLHVGVLDSQDTFVHFPESWFNCCALFLLLLESECFITRLTSVVHCFCFLTVPVSPLFLKKTVDWYNQ
jgi:hypothetical protein